MPLDSRKLYTCPACKADRISPFRFSAHRKSESCREQQRALAAETQLRFVGGYDDYRKLVVMRLSTFGKRRVKVLAAGIDAGIGACTIVDMDGRVRQYLHGEWEMVQR